MIKKCVHCALFPPWQATENVNEKPFKAGIDTLMFPLLSLRAQGTTEHGSPVSQQAAPFHPCARGDGDRQVMFSWGLGSEGGRKFSYKPVLSIHTQDHVSVWGMAGGPVQSYETIGI